MEEGEDLWIGTSSGLYIYDRSDDHFLYFDKTTKYGVFISCEVKKIVKRKWLDLDRYLGARHLYL